MQLTYMARLRRDAGFYVATLPDFPEAEFPAETRQDALAAAREGLVELLEDCFCGEHWVPPKPEYRRGIPITINVRGL